MSLAFVFAYSRLVPACVLTFYKLGGSVEHSEEQI